MKRLIAAVLCLMLIACCAYAEEDVRSFRGVGSYVVLGTYPQDADGSDSTIASQ